MFSHIGLGQSLCFLPMFCVGLYNADRSFYSVIVYREEGKVVKSHYRGNLGTSDLGGMLLDGREIDT
jgi:hypothetical protein